MREFKGRGRSVVLAWVSGAVWVAAQLTGCVGLEAHDEPELGAASLSATGSEGEADPTVLAEACMDTFLACVGGSDGSEAAFDACGASMRACMPRPPRVEGPARGERPPRREGGEAEEGERQGPPRPELRGCMDTLRTCVLSPDEALEPSVCAEIARECVDMRVAEFVDRACASAQERCQEHGEEACARVAERCEQGLPPLPPPPQRRGARGARGSGR